MAKIIDVERQEQEEQQVEEQLSQFEAPVEEQVTPEPQEPELPDKYQNKSVSELAQMHQEAEKLLGRQSS